MSVFDHPQSPPLAEEQAPAALVGELEYSLATIHWHRDRVMQFCAGMNLDDLSIILAWLTANMATVSPMEMTAFIERFQLFGPMIETSKKEHETTLTKAASTGKVPIVIPEVDYKGSEKPNRKLFESKPEGKFYKN